MEEVIRMESVENITETSRLANILHQLHKVLQHSTNTKNSIYVTCLKTTAINNTKDTRTGPTCSPTYARQKSERDRTLGYNNLHVTTSAGGRDSDCISAKKQTMIPIRDTESAVLNTVKSRNKVHCAEKRSSTKYCETCTLNMKYDKVYTKTAFSSTYSSERVSMKLPKQKFMTLDGRSKSTSLLGQYLLLIIFVLWHSSSCYAMSLTRDADIAWATSDTQEEIPPPTMLDEFVWPLMEEAPGTGTMSSRKRTERAAKRGVPPKFLIRHTLLQRLYSRNSYFLEILKNGKVRGTLNQNSSYNVVRLESIAAGVLAIYGIKSQRYLAMNRKGNLFGSKTFTNECKFYEKMANGLYFTYEAVPTSPKRRKRKRARLMGFDKNGKPKKGHRIKASNKGALFSKIVVPTKRKNRRRG